MPQISEKRIFKLLGSIYETVGGTSTEAWLCVYQEMAEIFQSGPGGFGLYVNSLDRLKYFATTVDPESLKLYDEYYQFASPFRNTIVKMRVGDCFCRIEHCPDDEYERTEIYQDFFRTQDIYNFEYHTICKRPGFAGGIVFSRPKSQNWFTANERMAMSFIMPHLRRAFEVYINFADVQTENQTILAALATMPKGVIVIDKDHKIKFANRRAESMISKNDGLVVDCGGSLRASFTADDKKLSMLLNGIFSPAIDNLAYHGGAHQISRSDGSRPLQVLVSPFAAHIFLGAGTEVMAMIFVHDPDERIETHETVLIQLYGLTPAEGHIAAILANGMSINEASAILNITHNTARTHLKHIFSKTDTNRQSDLVKLIVNGLSNLNIGG